MKMSKYSTLLRILAFVLSIMLLCGAMPVSALDEELSTEEPGETIVETAEPTEAEEQPTEDPQIPDETDGEETTEPPTEANTDPTEPDSSEEEEEGDITFTVTDAGGNVVKGEAVAGLKTIDVKIKRNTPAIDKKEVSVVFVPYDEYSETSLDDDNLIAGVDNSTKADWVELWRTSTHFEPELKFTDAKAPDFSDGEYMLAARDGFGNVATKRILLLQDAPTVTVSSAPSGWQNGSVYVYATVSDHVKSVTFTDVSSGETHSADRYSANTFYIQLTKSSHYSVTATDEAGNTSVDNGQNEIEIKIDEHNPAVTVKGYVDGNDKKIDPNKIWLGKNSTVYAVVEAEDKDGDKEQSGINADSFKLDGENADVTKKDDQYLIKLSDPTKAGQITVEDNAQNVSNKASTDIFRKDTTAPAQSDMQIDFSPCESAAGKILNILTFGLYTNQQVYITVMVNANAQSDISAATVKIGADKYLELMESSDDGHGVFSFKFLLPLNSDDDESAYDLTIQADDAAENESEEIKLSDIQSIHQEGTVIEGKKIYEVVSTNLTPKVDSFEVTGEAVDQYHATVSGDRKVNMAIADGFAGLDGDVEVYFGKSDEFEKEEDGTYSKKPAALKNEDVTRTPKKGSGNFAEKRIKEQIEFDLSDKLASGTYTVLAQAKNYAGNTGYLRKDIKIDNAGPVLSDKQLSPDSWTNGKITVSFTVKDEGVGFKDEDVTIKKPDGTTITAKHGDGDTYYFETEVNGTYIASAVDKLDNPSNDLEIKVANYDHDDPDIEITKYEPDGDKKWTSEKVKVTFEALDTSGSAVTLTVDDGSDVKHGEKTGEYYFIADENRVYTVTATDEAGNSKEAKTEPILFDNQKPIIEKVVLSIEEGNFKKFGIYDNKVMTATVYVRSPGNSPVDEIQLLDGGAESDDIAAQGAVVQDAQDKNLYSRTFTLRTRNTAYDLSITAKNRSKSEKIENIENVPLYIADEETERAVEDGYKDAFELVVTEHKPVTEFTEDAIEGYTAKEDAGGKHDRVFAGAGGGTVTATIKDQLSGVKSIKSVNFDGADVTKSENLAYEIAEDEKDVEVTVSYTFDEQLSSGKHTFEIAAENNAGNTTDSDNVSWDFYADQTPPAVIENSVDIPEGWTNQPIDVTFKVTDDNDKLGYYSGVDSVKINSGDPITPNEAGEYVFTADERKDYVISMTDKLGNSDTYTIEAKDIPIDVAAPEFVPYEDGRIFSYDDAWASQDPGIAVSFRLTDDLSGVDESSITVVGDSNGKSYSWEKTDDGYTFYADYYQTYTVTVNDLVMQENENQSSQTTPIINADGTDPEIESVNFEPAASVGERILNILTFGLYCNNDIKMTVKAKDAAPSAGIKTIEASHNDSITLTPEDFTPTAPNGDKDVTATRMFIIKADSAKDAKDIKLQVTDNVEHASDGTKSVENVDKYVIYPGAESAVEAEVGEGFEIVASTEAPKIETIDLKQTVGDKTNSGVTIGDHTWFKGEDRGTEVTVTAEISTELTKLHDIKVYLNNNDITDKVSLLDQDGNEITKNAENPGQITNFDDHSGEKIPKVKVSFSTGNLDGINRASSGNAENVVRIVAVGNNGVESEDSRTFYIDDTVPEITSVRFKPAKSPADAILNVLTFGLYSKNNIEMTVSVKDGVNGMPSSGIKEISVKGYGTIEADKFTSTGDNTDDSTTTQRTYTIKISDERYDPNMIDFDVKDNVGNSARTETAASLNEVGKLYAKNSDTAKIFDAEKFEIVSTEKAPEISKEITLSSTPEKYTDASGKVWYQGDTTDEVGMSFTVKDTLSKLHSVKAEVNGHNIINHIYTNFDNEAANTADGKDQWETGEGVTYSANTAQSDVYGHLHRISESSESNQFTVEAVNNSGISATKESGKFYIDDAAPYITKFEFKGDGYSDEYSDSENGGLNPANVELTKYGFYFKSTTDVTVTASDFVTKTNMQGSGVKKIGFRTVDINGKLKNLGEIDVDKNNQATFTVNADFKGQIYAYAVDNVTNKGSEITPAGLIVESNSAHESNSDATIEFGTTNYRGKDNNKLDLFSGNVTVSFTVSDTVSGLRDASYTVTNGNEVVEFQKVNVSNSGSLDNTSWTISKRETRTNLITRLALTDTISASRFNANNLKVTVTAHDRAGYTIKSEKSLSIDITKPKIDVKFDPANPVNTDSGNNYFSTSRTATITVTERNFDPADFDWSKMTAIEGTVPSYAAGANWSTSYSNYTDNSQHTATVTFANNGKYEVILNFTDMAGNKADQVDEGQFYIDKTAPTISVSYSPDTEYSNGTVTATVTIVEHNFNPDGKYLTFTTHYYAPDQTTVKSGPSLASWSTTGDTHTATLSFSEDGKYAFDIAFKDMALNAAQSYSGKTFYVDQTKPEISFGEAIKNNQAYDIQLQPEFSVFDYNYAGAESVTYTLTRYYYDFATGKQVPEVVDSSSVRAAYIEGVIKQLFTYPLFEKTEDNDGVYVLTVSATDRAGNVSDPASITFAVNCFGSVFLLASDETISLAESGYTNDAPDILIKEINVNQLKEQTMTLSYNNSNKKLGDKDYSITSSGGGNEWYEYLYKISAELFEKEGSYTVTASSVDVKLGTITTNRTVNAVEGENAVHKNCPVSFIVDKTAPSVTINGVEENGAYSEAEREIQITCLDDNLDKDSVILKINGEVVELDDSEIDDSLVGQLDISHTILASGKQTDYRVEVEAKDYAGETGSNSVNKFTLSATWLTMFFHNTAAVIITGVVLAALIALAILLAVKKRRKAKQ